MSIGFWPGIQQHLHLGMNDGGSLLGQYSRLAAFDVSTKLINVSSPTQIFIRDIPNIVAPGTTLDFNIYGSFFIGSQADVYPLFHVLANGNVINASRVAGFVTPNSNGYFHLNIKNLFLEPTPPFLTFFIQKQTSVFWYVGPTINDFYMQNAVMTTNPFIGETISLEITILLPFTNPMYQFSILRTDVFVL